VRPGNFYLDPRSAVSTAVISHAHADHFHTGCGTAYATPGTHRLIQTQTQYPVAAKLESKPYGEVFSIGETQVCLWPAGHIPGSAMISIYYGGQHALYTGDISTQSHPMAESLSLPDTPVDWLLCESTFADMPFTAEDPMDAFARIYKEASVLKLPLLLGVYSLGKAQRMSHLIHSMLTGVDLRVHPRIESFHATYRLLGFDPGLVQPYRRLRKSDTTTPIILMPPTFFNRMAITGKYYSAFVSGWDKRSHQMGISAYMPISDHPDAESLRQFIQSVSPKVLSPVHGKYATLPAFCASNGIRLHPIS